MTQPSILAGPSANGHVRPNLLYLVHRLPYPPDKGDRIRAFQLLRYLSQKAAVYLACLADEPIAPGVLNVLGQYCARAAAIPLGPARWCRAFASLALGRTISEGAFHSPQLRALLCQWTANTHFDACLASASSMVPYLRLPELKGIPAVIDLVDVDSQKWLDFAAAKGGLRSLLYRVEAGRLRCLETGLPSWARAVTLVSKSEANLYQKFCAAGQVHVVGNGVDLDEFQPRPRNDEEGCIFLGALDYLPNVDGITWFCQEVWPRVRAVLPGAKMNLVGRRPTLAVRRLSRLPGVELVGQVPDVRPFLARAAVAVAPMRIARGVQNKILEAMAMAKAVVVSPACRNGLSAQAGTHYLAASSPEEWTQSVVQLLTDAGWRHRLGAAARQHVAEHHRWESCLEPLDALLDLPTAANSIPQATGTNQRPFVAAGTQPMP